MRPDLADDEVDAICCGLTQHSAKIRYLKSLGLRVERRPNGRPLVARADWERRFTPTSAPSSNGPKWKIPA